VSASGSRAAFAGWWEARCRGYLDRNFGRAGEEILAQLTAFFFPPEAEPTLPEQLLPLSFVHLRLLGGEPLPAVQERAGRLAGLMGELPPRRSGGQPSVGALYLLLTSATSTPGKLSSLARAQAAFFSLLLRRLAAALDRGEGEEAIRRELAEGWEIRGEAGISAALQGARGYWRRLREPNLGLGSLPFEPGEWMAENGLADEMTAARRFFPESRTPEAGGHLEALVERLAAVEVLRNVAGDENAAALAAIQGSVAAALGGITPWEAEALHPAQPLLASLAAWSGRLSLLGGGETPTAYPGRERLADWIGEALDRPASDGGSGDGESGEGSDASLPPARRLAVGGDTYLMFGVDDSAPSEAVSIELAAPRREEEGEIILEVRFGGENRAFRFDLSDGKDLLAAVRLTLQPDVRADLFLRGGEGGWRFAASRYLQPGEAHRAAWAGLVLEYLHREFGGEEDRVRLAILKGVKGEG
jgi:hypothetical protein